MDEGSSSPAAPEASPGPTGPASVFVMDEQSQPVATERLRRLAAHVLAACEVAQPVELSLRLVERDEIRELNEGYLQGSGPTDVLAFPLDAPEEEAFGPHVPDQPALLGDVVVCPAVAADQAVERDEDAAGELELLVVHGILHLLGHDHAEPGERSRMFALTDRLLAGFRQDPPERSAP